MPRVVSVATVAARCSERITLRGDVSRLNSSCAGAWPHVHSRYDALRKFLVNQQIGSPGSVAVRKERACIAILESSPLHASKDPTRPPGTHSIIAQLYNLHSSIPGSMKPQFTSSP
ncbi:unnamed protein product [Symbiodinium natans]|uniref:Uncharacterized protein n=1 Tax=Symbiodinium natans TaxID=878477 RepID=A0A812MSP1_9DINO|nr:unnamed protein product [Symbiodinium natans]